MPDIDTLLKNAADGTALPDPGLIDADLARGRAALATARHHRTYRRVSYGTVGALAAGALGVLIASSGPAHRTATQPLASRGGTHAIHHPAAVGQKPHIRLAAYDGPQLAGFNVSEVPEGWHLSTSTQFALLITPDGSNDKDPNVFVDKLAVLTSSRDQQGLGPGTPVTVNGQAGRVRTDDGTLMLDYDAPNGFGIDIQAPASLGWTSDQIVQFAEHVTVTGNAVHSVG